MGLFTQNQEETYVPDRYVDENEFIGKPPVSCDLPKFDEVRDRLPQPIWEGHDGAVDCYWAAWRLAFSNLCNPTEKSGFTNPFIDTAFNGNLFMWDSSFILMFARYGINAFDFQQTLNNFYALQHKDGFISRELNEQDGTERFNRFDPTSTGPDVMGWCELEYYRLTGDKSRLGKVFSPLLAYHNWLREYRTWRDGLYWSSGFGSGMDNQPRMKKHYSPYFSTGHMAWVDVSFQGLASCESLIKIANIIGRTDELGEILEEKEQLTRVINEKLWDEDSAYYYDLWNNGKLNGVKSIGSYWGLLTDGIPEGRLERFVAHLENEKEFKRVHRVPTLSADDKEYSSRGRYWCGSVWSPTTYMVLAGLRRNGYEGLAHEIGINHHQAVQKCFEATGTFWENYAPDFIEKGEFAKDEFVGWTGNPPISVLFEYVFGIEPRADENKIIWHINLTDRHGVKKYPFNGTSVELLCEKRQSRDERPKITVKSDKKLTVECIWDGGIEKISTESRG